MPTPSLTIPALLADARKDFPALRKQLDAPLRRLRAELERNGSKMITHMVPWRSPRKHDWLILLHYSARAVRVHTLLWFKDADGHTAAVWTGASGLAYHISAQALEAYAQRFDPTAAPKERAQSFFLDNPFFEMQVETPQGEHHWNVSVGMYQGLGLGEWDTTTDIVHVRSYVPINTMVEPGTPLEGLRSPFQGLSLQQRIELADQAAEVERKQRAA
ncbi:MAG: hypothetical protein IPM46_06275 [Flavobacteriales bacterium]|nr:hypothetical protein [Flavobacteriales bacterium]